MLRVDIGDASSADVDRALDDIRPWLCAQYSNGVQADAVAREIHGKVLATRRYQRDLQRLRAGGVAVPRPAPEPTRARELSMQRRSLSAPAPHVQRQVADATIEIAPTSVSVAGVPWKS